MGNTGRGEIGRVAGDVRTREEGGGDDGARRVARELDRRVERVTGESRGSRRESARVCSAKRSRRARASVPRDGREERARLFLSFLLSKVRASSRARKLVRLVHASLVLLPDRFHRRKLSRVSHVSSGRPLGFPQLSSHANRGPVRSPRPRASRYKSICEAPASRRALESSHVVPEICAWRGEPVKMGFHSMDTD